MRGKGIVKTKGDKTVIKNVISYFIVLLVIFFGPLNVLACGCGCSGNNCGANNQSLNQERINEEKVQCPVMKNWILASEAADKIDYNGKTYYFCCGGCKEKFLAEPENYIESQS